MESGLGHRFDRIVTGRAIHRLIITAGLFALGWAGTLRADILPGDVNIALEPVAAGLTSPITLTHAHDGSGRLFVADQIGEVRVIKDGQLLATPYLDISDVLVNVAVGFDERGLLGLAFHPEFATNGRFFVRYSAPRTGSAGEPCFGTSRGCHAEVLAEYTADPAADVADPTGTVLFSVDEPEFNHNAGMVVFGPDGYLYFSLGDGGGANDGLSSPSLPHGPIGHGQNIETYLGSLLRIDVDSAPEAPLAYAIPADNPFVDAPGLDEIYAYGFRNPFRFSFDDGPGGSGTLFLGDVGQDVYEELDIVVAGGNYGWAIREGAHCFDPFNPDVEPPMCDTTGLIDPIAEYTQAEGGLSIIAGYVYRGAQNPALNGTLLLGDFGTSFASPSGQLYYLDDPEEPNPQMREFRISPDDRAYDLFLKGWGRGEDGEIYVLGSTNLGAFGNTGFVERVVVVGDCDGDRTIDLPDLVSFTDCLSGPIAVKDDGCGCADYDVDDRVDMRDLQDFQNEFTGAP